MKESLLKFKQFLQEQVNALKMLREAGLVMPTLMLLYATIDTVSYIRSDGTDKNAGQRFRDFVKDYLEDDLTDLNSHDLWGARCALLHTATPTSTASLKGDAKELLYCWGNANIELLYKIIDKEGRRDKYAATSIDALFLALGNGLDKFMLDLEKDSILCEDCMKRVDKIYVQITT